MAFSTYEELMAVVEERRKDTLTLEVDMDDTFSQAYEDAKEELQKAEAMEALMAASKQGAFMASNLDGLRAKVKSLRPEPNLVWVRYERLSLSAWSALVKESQLTPIEQYEKVLPKVFVGVYGQDPEEDEVEPLSVDYKLVSSKGDKGIFPGGKFQAIVATFIKWQNSGGHVRIRPTKSSQD